MIEQYKSDRDFSSIYDSGKKKAFQGFYQHDGYLFKMGKLCISNYFIRELLIREAHGGGLTGHFDEKKT